MLLAVIPFTVFLVILGAGFVYTSSSYFCASCHEMSTQYVSWRRSSHKDVACMNCHSEPGIIGEVKTHLKGSRQVFVHMTRLYSRGELFAEVKDSSCQRCHQDIKETDTRFRSIHLQHAEVRMNCVDCHAGLVHGDIGGGFPYQQMLCKRCHPKLSISESVSVNIETGGR